MTNPIETKKKCRWCLGSMQYEVFELHSKEYPLTRQELEIHKAYLFENAKYGAPPETQEAKEAERAKGIIRKGASIKGIIVTYQELIRVYPDGEHLEKVKANYGTHCHLCHVNFTKDHNRLVKEIDDAKAKKDLTSVGLSQVDLARIWSNV